MRFILQGFLFSKPMPADALEDMIRREPRLQVMASGHRSA
jgi:EAL domain-containing protein (putative c-di-GMP-specific phosphodiesterase class I)